MRYILFSSQTKILSLFRSLLDIGVRGVTVLGPLVTEKLYLDWLEWSVWHGSYLTLTLTLPP